MCLDCRLPDRKIDTSCPWWLLVGYKRCRCRCPTRIGPIRNRLPAAYKRPACTRYLWVCRWLHRCGHVPTWQVQTPEGMFFFIYFIFYLEQQTITVKCTVIKLKNNNNLTSSVIHRIQNIGKKQLPASKEVKNSKCKYIKHLKRYTRILNVKGS